MYGGYQVISKLFESLYLKVFINIILEHAKTNVYVEYCSKNGVVKNFEKSFKGTTLTDKIEDYLQEHIKESPFYYLSFLDTSKTQGALPTCHEREFLRYGDIIDVKHICYNNKWSSYTAKRDLDLLQNRYADIGIDFIFSPFHILARFFKEKIDGQATMFLLVQQDSVTLAVFEHSELLFGEYMDIHSSAQGDELLIEEDSDDIDLELDGGIDLEDVDNFDSMNSLDDFSDIEDLDSLEEIEEFSEAKDLESGVSTSKEHKNNAFDDDGAEGFNDDYQRFLLVQSAMKHYYKNPIYNAKFIEHVYVADSVGVSSDLKRYLEEELFLTVYIRNIALIQEMCDVAKGELA